MTGGKKKLAKDKADDYAQALRLKAQLFSNLKHELKTPLHTILALSDLLKNEVDGKLNAEQNKSLGLIIKNGTDLLGLLNSIIDFEELSNISSKPVKFDLNQLVNSIISTYESQLKNYNFLANIDDLPKEFFHDSMLIGHIINQLLSNAIKFTPKGMQIELDVRVNQQLVIEVIDEGVGIDTKIIETVFDGFVQEDYDDRRKFSGLGLGLAIVKKTVQILGGSITLDSSKDHGTKFRVEIPLCISEKKSNILIVDDEKAIRETLVACFQAQGCLTMQASNGIEALHLISEQRPDLILLDIAMPEMDGYQLMQNIRSKSWGKNLPIIMMSALDNAEQRERGFEAGVSDYIVKPFGFKEVWARVNTILSKQ